MKFDKFKFKLDKYIYENWTFRIVTLILAGVIALEGYLIVEKVNNQRVVILPPKITKEFWVSGNRVSKSYLEQMGTYIAYSLLNVTPDNSKMVLSLILPFVEPDFYAQVRSAIQEQLDYIVNNQISRVFYPASIDVSKAGVIKIKGLIKDTIGNNVVNQYTAEVNIGYTIKQGRFFINSIIVRKAKL